jgi:hypothetical protein
MADDNSRSVIDCDIDFRNFCHCQVQNLKFCSHFLKAPKAKANVNKVHYRGILLTTVGYCTIM